MEVDNKEQNIRGRGMEEGDRRVSSGHANEEEDWVQISRRRRTRTSWGGHGRATGDAEVYKRTSKGEAWNEHGRRLRRLMQTRRLGSVEETYIFDRT